MKFSILEQEVQQNIKDVEQNSNIQIEFHIYSPDRTNPQVDQYIAQLEQRISAFGAENTEQKDEVGHDYSMFRLIGKKFRSPKEVADFFRTQFKDFIQLMNQIWRNSKNFIRVILVDDSNPPNRIPGRNYTLLYNSDYNEMLITMEK